MAAQDRRNCYIELKRKPYEFRCKIIMQMQIIITTTQFYYCHADNKKTPCFVDHQNGQTWRLGCDNEFKLDFLRRRVNTFFCNISPTRVLGMIMKFTMRYNLLQ